MPQKMNGLLQTYISEIKKIYGTHLSKMPEEISDQTQT